MFRIPSQSFYANTNKQKRNTFSIKILVAVGNCCC